jgi:hypothetical protein
MIKKYNDFINESKYQEVESKYNTIGEYVEDVSTDNDYLLGIVSNYINDVDTDIRVSNAVNLLKDFDKEQLFNRIYNYLKDGEKDKSVSTMTHVVIKENIETILPTPELRAGKNTFLSFLKCITALGLKSISKSEMSKDDFLFYYEVQNVDVKSFKSIINRFKTLNMFVDLVDYTHNECGLYYGIKYDSTFEYGFHTTNILPIGQFKLTKSNLNWLLLLQSPSATSLKKDIVGLDIKDIYLCGKAAIDMRSYDQGTYKSGPKIEDVVIIFEYSGIGRWDGTTLDQASYLDIRNGYKNWLSKFKWSKKVQFNVLPQYPLILFKLKIK